MHPSERITDTFCPAGAGVKHHAPTFNIPFNHLIAIEYNRHCERSEAISLGLIVSVQEIATPNGSQ
ncbi:MAG: hypothetical protein ACKO34_09425 [Vampirovibrionales bacterium]